MTTSTDMPASKGGGCIFLVFLLIVTSGVATVLYPLLQRKFPDITSHIDEGRGVYDGPVLLDPPSGRASVFSNNKLKDERKLEQSPFDIYFIPATSGDYSFFAAAEYGELVQLDLYQEASSEILNSNRRTPAATGRQADGYSMRGDTMPEHGHSLRHTLSAGERYFLRVTTKDPSTLGTQVTTTLEYEDDFIEITTLWGAFVGAVIGLYILLILYKFHQWKKTTQANTLSDGIGS